MATKDSYPPNGYSKDHKTILEQTYKLLYDKSLTRLEVTHELGIQFHSSVCFPVYGLLQNNRAKVIRKRTCKISGRTSEELTTNPKLFPPDIQYKLFDCD